MDRATGVPFLSGVAPRQPDDEACRKCNKEFNLIFNRSRNCAHCGYQFCHSCTEFTAVVARPPSAPAPGLDATLVCSFCIDMLNITAASPSHLKTLPLAKLRKYATAYNISLTSAVEKDDVVRALVTERLAGGYLSPAREAYYRRYAIPSRNERSRGIFMRGSEPPAAAPPPPPSRTRPDFARPDLAADPPISPQPPSASSRPPQPPPRSPPQPPVNSRPTSAPRAPLSQPSQTTRPTPPPPTPSMSALLTYSPSQISSLSVHALKAILLDNHVHLGPGMLEKEELVSRVRELVNSERQEEAERRRRDEEERLAAQRSHEDREREEMEQALREVEEMEKRERERTRAPFGHGTPNSQAPRPSPSTRLPPERNGMCVVCQDEDANIAIVDCGHLALCRACSELVMNSTRECPLCRVRIVSEARLLRIFRS